MADGVALNGKSLSEVARNHSALFSGQPSAYDGINEFNTLLRNAMSQYLTGKGDAVETFRQALRERSMLMTSPEIRNNHEAKNYLQGIIVTDKDPAEALRQTIAMHGFVDDPAYQGEAVPEEADVAVEEHKPLL